MDTSASAQQLKEDVPWKFMQGGPAEPTAIGSYSSVRCAPTD